MKPLLVIVALISWSAQASTKLSFGEYYPHTRWIDSETHAIQIDAYPNRLVITRKGERAMIVRGCWRGRAFLRGCRFDYFGVAHEGVDAAVDGDNRFEKFHFRRVQPDPV